MKYGGITWWRNNYGSILQAYALQEELKEFNNIDYEIICQYGKKIVSISNLYNKIHSIGLIGAINRAFWKYCVPALKKRTVNNQKFVDKYLNVSSREFSANNIKDTNKIYDGFICGSDQIWNPTFSDATDIYRLHFVDDDKPKIAYAPSIGVKKLNSEQVKKYKSDLGRFTALSCREKEGTDLINSIFGKEICTTVLDPTLLVNKRIWEKIISKRLVKDKYIFVYLLRGTKKQRKEIEKFARKRNLKIVTIPFLETDYKVWYDLKFGDYKIWDATPADFLSLIKYSEYVFTDSFHSSVFSCIYHKSFFIFPKIGKAQSARLKNLITILGLPTRFIQREKDIYNLNSIDWIKVDKKINLEKNKSYHYLKKALSI